MSGLCEGVLGAAIEAEVSVMKLTAWLNEQASADMPNAMTSTATALLDI